ncbi:MAG TPA: hypothetical protein VII99_12145 [Bacteroidia bacterium]
MKLVSKALQNGKSITTQADVYYLVADGLLVTHITAPVEYLVITNNKGEFKIYDLKENTISQTQGADFSSENSFIHDFLNGNTNDMGLRSTGFQLKSTKVEEDMVIANWVPPLELLSKMNRVEVVHENYLPIYMAFYGKKEKLLSKIFYSNYKKAGDINLPGIITEFQYQPNGDSTITKRIYSDFKVNGEVDTKWLNYKIPSNAKVVK